MALATVTGSFLLKQSTVVNRPFFFGTTGQTVAVTLSKGGTGAFGAMNGNSGNAVEISSGWYYAPLAAVDVGTLGFLSYHCTASSGGPADFQDQVVSQIFTDLNMDTATGRVKILNNLQQNTAINGYTFPMTSSTTGQRQTGLTVTAQRTLAGSGFAPCANQPTEITGTGIYSINFLASDLNAATLGILFTAPNGNDLYIPLTPTP